MPLYAYRALDGKGAAARGVAEAANENDLYAQLRERGLNMLSCSASLGAPLGRQIPLREQALFCRHLHALVQAGIPVAEALADVAAARPGARLSRHLPHLLQRVAAGKTLSAAFAELTPAFDPLVVFILRAGEKTGRLAPNLERLHQSLEWKDQFRTDLRKSLGYPLIQLVLAGLAVAVLVGVTVPQIIKLLAFMGDDLPWYAQGIVSGMRWIGAGLAGLLAFAGIAGLMLPLARALGPGLRLAADRLVLRLPLIGPVLLKSGLASLAHAMAAMLESGVPMMEILDILPRLIGNRALAADLARVRERVAQGSSLTAALQSQMAIPSYMVRLIRAGEDGGDIGVSLGHIATLYQNESRQAVDALMKGSSLGITLVVGGMLALMVGGVIYPLYNGLTLMVTR